MPSVAPLAENKCLAPPALCGNSFDPTSGFCFLEGLFEPCHKQGVVVDKRSTVTYVTRSAVGILLSRTLDWRLRVWLSARLGMVSRFVLTQSGDV